MPAAHQDHGRVKKSASHLGAVKTAGLFLNWAELLPSPLKRRQHYISRLFWERKELLAWVELPNRGKTAGFFGRERPKEKRLGRKPNFPA
jgi:hypothetical protein